MHHASQWVRALSVLSLAIAAALVAGCGSTPTPDALEVNAVMADPMAYTGTIAVRGIVQNIDPGASAVTLIDETEYETCGLSPCGSAGLLSLTVPFSGTPSPGGSLYDGALPTLEDRVVVVGEIKSGGQGLYFDVERIERGSSTLLARK